MSKKPPSARSSKSKEIRPAKVGRPPSIVADDKVLEKLKLIGSAQHNITEAAALLGVSKSCLYEFLENNKSAKDAYEEGLENGRASLRRMQFQSAQKGNITMQIWLGKQYLGQSDKREIETTGKDGGPILQETTVRLDPASEKRLLDLLE